NKNRALEIIANFSQAAVLVVGDIMLDHFIWGKVARISPEAPVPVVDVQTENIMLGGCANVINNIHAIGGRALGTGVVGADEMGERLCQEFLARRIDVGGVIVEKARPTTLKTRIVAHGQQIVRFDRESRAPAAKDSIERIIAYVESRLNQIGAIVVSDYNKGLITQDLLDGIRKVVAGRKLVVCVDPKRDDFSFYRGFDVITPNHHEAGRALGREINNEADLRRTGATLMERFDFKAALITRGEEGISLFEKGNSLVHTHFPTEAREVFDVTGAGDTVIGVFALAMAADASFKEAAALANRAAGIVVGKVGTATVSREELSRSL
ncbi:MAG: D-glycero-beta-D-manno-heptose-7-phosphate kinase, partial [Deltaproteobacteria bacterium]|nr:D-glycero-beta-D-manno-heptose-7-phosphate kinase [Deltaproteobacteria bacterium]